MKKMKMHSPNLTDENIVQLQQLFPGCVTESKGDDGEIKLAVDFDQLKQELSDHIIEGPQERYQLNWPGKREALLTANAPLAKTLRPCREESVNFDTTQNLFIEGDNLEALKLLQDTYLGEVKMIYIDPPYNKDADVIYKDNFTISSEEYFIGSMQKDELGNHLIANNESNGRYHSDWLSMIFPRLKLAKNFLSEDGLIFISIDSREVSNLRAIMDEIFGAKNCIGVLPTIMNLKGNNDSFAFSDTHEFTLVYAKSKSTCSVNQLPIDEESLDSWDEDSIGIYKRADTLRRTGQDASRERRPKGWFPIFIDENHRVYATGDDNPLKSSDLCMWPIKDTGEELSWTWSKSKINDEYYNLLVIDGRSGKTVYKKQRPGLGDIPTSKPKSILYKPEYSSSNGTSAVAELFDGKKVFDSPPKPRALIKDFVTVATEKDSVVLDFFAGTGTCADAVIAQNATDGGKRRFIMVQLGADCDKDTEAYKAGHKTIAEITKERIRRAGRKTKDNVSLLNKKKNLDIGFRVLKIDASNMADVYYSPDQIKQDMFSVQVDNIKEGRDNPEDLLFQVLLDWGVDLTLPIRKETIQDKTILFVDDNALIACFDTGITEALVKELAGFHPLRIVFRDNGFMSDAVKINVDQIFKQLSPSTEVKSI